MSHVQKWGNSLAVRLPKSLAAELGWTEGTKVELSVEGGRIVVAPAPPPRLTLKDLLDGCRPEDRPETIDWGPDVGRERINW